MKRHMYIITKITISNERQLERGVSIDMRPRAPWRQGEAGTFQLNLLRLAHTALRSSDAFNALWNPYAKEIIHTGLARRTHKREEVLKRFYAMRRANVWKARYAHEPGP
jgi:hypothetical protein